MNYCPFINQNKNTQLLSIHEILITVKYITQITVHKKKTLLDTRSVDAMVLTVPTSTSMASHHPLTATRKVTKYTTILLKIPNL